MKRSVLLDLLRILAVAAVVLVHIFQMLDHTWGEKFGFPDFYFVSLGGIGVTVLVIISGITLGLRYAGSDVIYLDFIKKRIFHIYPTYYVILIGGIIAYFVREYYGFGPNPDLSLIDIPLSLTATYVFFGLWGGPFVGASWFLGLIISLYLIFPVLVAWFRKKPHLTLLVLLIVSTATRFLLGRYDLLPLRSLDWFFLSRVFEFGLGIYLAIMFPKDFWFILNGNNVVETVSAYLGKISFPFYLAHGPIRHTVKHLKHYSFSTAEWLSVFLLMTLIASIIVFEFDQRIMVPQINMRFLRRE